MPTRSFPFMSALLAALMATSPAPAGAKATLVAYSVTDRIAGPDGGWDYATFDPALNRVYLSHADSVFVLDVATGATSSLGVAPHGHKILALDRGAVLAVTVGGDNTLALIDAKSGAPLASVPTDLGPDSALLEPASGLVVVAAHRAGVVDLIDPKTRRSIGSIAVGGTLEELASDGAGRIFVNVENSNEIVALDLRSRTVIKRLKLQGCDGPTGLAFAPDAQALIAACDGAAAVVDARTLTLLSVLPIGRGPDAALYDPKRKLVLIPCGDSGDLWEIDVSAPGAIKALGASPTEKFARTGALDPATGKVYLPTARFAAPPPGARRGTMEHGSFHILVLSPGG